MSNTFPWSILIASNFPTYPPELNPEASDQLKQVDSEVAGLLAQLVQLDQKRVDILRQVAWQKGLASLELSALKSENGAPFVVFDRKGGHKEAIAFYPDSRPETAYQCLSVAGGPYDASYSCGWVRGMPIRRSYIDLRPMAGSNGVEYFCLICQKNLGKFETKLS